MSTVISIYNAIHRFLGSYVSSWNQKENNF